MTFGDKLSALRREQNYTQEQLADLLGVSRQSVSKWESGAAYPETEKLIRLSTLFNCSLDYLLRDAPREAAAAPTAPQQAEAAPDAAGGRFVVTVPYPCYERKSRRQLFGMPLYHVNIGPGRVAKGFFAVGLIARGVVSVGLISIGFVSVGLISIGLLALGLDAVGLIAMGGVAIGAVALGAAALGLCAAGGAVFFSTHVLEVFTRSAPPRPGVSRRSVQAPTGRFRSAPWKRSAARSSASSARSRRRKSTGCSACSTRQRRSGCAGRPRSSRCSCSGGALPQAVNRMRLTARYSAFSQAP